MSQQPLTPQQKWDNSSNKLNELKSITPELLFKELPE
jgi:hypothetical protein